jgi:hypothetical protein
MRDHPHNFCGTNNTIKAKEDWGQHSMHFFGLSQLGFHRSRKDMAELRYLPNTVAVNVWLNLDTCQTKHTPKKEVGPLSYLCWFVNPLDCSYTPLKP